MACASACAVGSADPFESQAFFDFRHQVAADVAIRRRSHTGDGLFGEGFMLEKPGNSRCMNSDTEPG
jgi:hypothetical protein